MLSTRLLSRQHAALELKLRVQHRTSPSRETERCSTRRQAPFQRDCIRRRSSSVGSRLPLKFRSGQAKAAKLGSLLSQLCMGRPRQCDLQVAARPPPLLSTTLVWSVMSLAEASEARKERLIALRRRKAGEVADDSRYAHPCKRNTIS